MDNRSFEILSEGSNDLLLALKLSGLKEGSSSIFGYKIVSLSRHSKAGEPGADHRNSRHTIDDERGVPTMVLYAHLGSEITAFPSPLNLQGAALAIESWLSCVPRVRDTSSASDVDKAWRVFTDDWGHVAGDNRACVAIQPAWALYGK
jgi:hypothetical protein